MNLRKLNWEKVLEEIQNKVEKYLIDNQIKRIIIGISGGLDSALNTVILYPICNKLDIQLVGRYSQIESNKKEEEERASNIAKYFTHQFEVVDLTDLYFYSLSYFDKCDKERKGLVKGFSHARPSNIKFDKPSDLADKIRLGNIKARLRMIDLFNLSALTSNSLVIDNDNMTEHLLGFWTLYGDVGTLVPLSDLFKSEVYELALYIANNLPDEKKEALMACIEATPTDGLGITNSDYEQFGVSSYDEVDNILMVHLGLYQEIIFDVSQEQIDKIISRHVKSEFKRNCPYRIRLNLK